MDSRLLLAVIGLIAVIGNGIQIYCSYIAHISFWGLDYFYDFNHTFLGVFLFLLFKAIFDKISFSQKLKLVLNLADKYSYETYLVHQFFILGPYSTIESVFSSLLGRKKRDGKDREKTGDTVKMKKPYAESTLKRKYKETGIEPKRIMKAQAYLTACANFYKIIEIKDVWKVIGKKCGVTKAEFDALLPIFSRDGSLSFYIERDDEFYSDGTDELLLIDMDFLIVANDDFNIDQFNQAEERGEEYDGPEPLVEDWDLFFELDKQRSGKPLFIPADILHYADEDYIEETPQVKAMRHFLEYEVRLDGKTINPGDDGRTPAEEASWWAVVEMNDIICDLSVSATQAIQMAMDCLADIGYQFQNDEQIERFVNLFTDMSNNTRMPSNRGFTPNEMMRRSGGGTPTSISFGSGLRQNIQSGELNGDELKRAFMGEAGLPLGLRTNLMREVDSALKPGEEKWIGGTLVKGEKIRPNDPCPCGSGKKYKKCCGKKTYDSQLL